MNRRGPAPAPRPSPPAGARPRAPGEPRSAPRTGARNGGRDAPKSAAGAAPAPALEGRLARLEGEIEQFRVDIERFWNGALPIPPEELRTRIQRELRDLRGVTLKSAVEQFRMATIEARFNSLSELFGRRLREREEGRAIAVPHLAHAVARHDPRAGIVFRGEPDAPSVEALWSGLVASGGARLELETFRGYLVRQLVEIRTRTGAAAVQFRVVQEEGKLKLKAKPVTGAEEGS
jgi:hypothetical protein